MENAERIDRKALDRVTAKVLAFGPKRDPKPRGKRSRDNRQGG